MCSGSSLASCGVRSNVNREKWCRVKCEPGNVVFFLEGLRIFVRVGSNVRVRAVPVE